MMTCDHDWRQWPYSQDWLCIKCNYQIIDGKHHPSGNPEWTVPGKQPDAPAEPNGDREGE